LIDLRTRNWYSLIVATMVVASLPGFLIGCGEQGESGSKGHTDSAGIEIVQNHASAARPLVWRIEETPFATVRGDADSASIITGVMGALRTSRNRTLVHGVGRRGARLPRLYDSTGKFVMALGREGRGPGEFVSVSKLGLLPGDSIWGFDDMLGAISVFTPSGEFVRRASFTGLDFGCTPLGAFTDGSVIMRCFKLTDNSHAVTDLVRVTTAGAKLGTIISDSTPWNPENGWMPHPLLETGSHGVYRGAARSYEIRSYTADGKLVRIVRTALEPSRVTAEDIEAQIKTQISQAVLHGAPAEQAERETRTFHKTHPIPEEVSVWSHFMEDADGNLWAMEFRLPFARPKRWLIFDPRGKLLGTMETPAGWVVHEIGRDYMLISTESDEGLPRVEMHRLVKPAS
jgi:hypothetical protein